MTKWPKKAKISTVVSHQIQIAALALCCVISRPHQQVSRCPCSRWFTKATTKSNTYSQLTNWTKKDKCARESFITATHSNIMTFPITPIVVSFVHFVSKSKTLVSSKFYFHKRRSISSELKLSVEVWVRLVVGSVGIAHHWLRTRLDHKLIEYFRLDHLIALARFNTISLLRFNWDWIKVNNLAFWPFQRL